MPPVSQPGSRAGMVSALVAFVVLFFISTILWIYAWVEWNRTTQDLTNLKRTYQSIIADAERNGDELRSIEALKDSADYRGRSAFDILWSQKNALAKAITGKEGNAEDAKLAGKTALDNAAAKLKPASVSIPTDSLVSAVSTMASAIADRHARIEDLNAKLADEAKQRQAMEQQNKEALDAKDQQLQAALADKAKVEAEVAAYRADKDRAVADSDKARKDEINKAADERTRLAADLAKRENETKKLKKDLDTVLARLNARRPDVKDPIVRHADGKITRLAGGGTLYIDLGSGEQISPGMTFQVFDKIEGVPALQVGDNEDVMPEGKGSIEVIRVGDHSSECRVIKSTPGAQMLEGDVIANLIYDKNARYTFKVYGDFDLDRNGVATSQETEILKRLIVQWGGKVSDDLNVSTDFVVMGVEPQLPQYSEEERKDPINAAKLEQAQKALDAYLNVEQQAKDLYIPVMNQNRFLHFIGYYDLAKQ